MKKISYSVVACSALFCFMFFSAPKAHASLAGGAVNAIVTFGNQPPGGGVCIGDGICVALPSPDTSKRLDGVPAKFDLDALDATTLLITFKMTDLMDVQPEQATKMLSCTQPGAGGITPTYQFGAPYILSQPMYSALGLPPNSTIQPSSIITVTISGNYITLHVKYAY